MHKFLFKIIILFFFYFTSAYPLKSQVFDWVLPFSSYGEIISTSIVADNLGNVIIAGDFHLNQDFDPGPGVFDHQSFGGSDYFITKHDSVGNLVWASFSGPNFNAIDRINLLAIDSARNVYAVGQVDLNLIFVLKLDPDGNTIWKKDYHFERYNGAPLPPPTANALHVDDHGNILIAGTFLDSMDFDPGPNVFLMTTQGEQDAFLTKLDPNGNFIWAKSFSGKEDSFDHVVSANGITTDNENNIYVTGGFTFNVDFDPGPDELIKISSGKQDVFISKLSQDGGLIWIKQIISAFNSIDSKGMDIGIDQAGRIYVLSSNNRMSTYDPGGEAYVFPDIGLTRQLVLVINASGEVLWHIDSPENFSDFEVFPNGGFMISGILPEGVDFDPRPEGVYFLHPGEQPGITYVSQYDDQGRFLWARGFVRNGVISYHVCADVLGNIFGTGWFQGNSLFETEGVEILLNALTPAEFDGYLFKYKKKECTGQQVEYYVPDQMMDTGAEPNSINLPSWKSPHILNKVNTSLPTHQDLDYYAHSSKTKNYLQIKVKNSGCNMVYNSKIELYFSIAETGLAWPETWQDYHLEVGGDTVLAGGKISEIAIPPMYLRDEWQTNFSWEVPLNPQLFQDSTVNVSILARIVSDEDPMTFTETKNLIQNVAQNNNLAWRVMRLVY